MTNDCSNMNKTNKHQMGRGTDWLSHAQENSKFEYMVETGNLPSRFNVYLEITL